MKKILLGGFLVVIIILICNVDLLSQEADSLGVDPQEVESLVSDRPDKTESAVTVPKNAFQIETGFIYINDHKTDDKFPIQGGNSTLLRFGLFEDIELRLELGYLSVFKERSNQGLNDTTIHGFAPVIVGFKGHLLKQKKGRPDIAVLSMLVIPNTGKQDFEVGNVAQNFLIAGSYGFSDRISFGANVGGRWQYGNTGFTFMYSGSMGIGIVKGISCFAELFGNFPTIEDSKSSHFFDAGFIFLVRHNLQLDIAGAVGLTKYSPDYYITAGLVWRIPR